MVESNIDQVKRILGQIIDKNESQKRKDGFQMVQILEYDAHENASSISMKDYVMPLLMLHGWPENHQDLSPWQQQRELDWEFTPQDYSHEDFNRVRI